MDAIPPLWDRDRVRSAQGLMIGYHAIREVDEGLRTFRHTLRNRHVLAMNRKRGPTLIHLESAA